MQVHQSRTQAVVQCPYLHMGGRSDAKDICILGIYLDISLSPRQLQYILEEYICAIQQLGEVDQDAKSKVHLEHLLEQICYP